MGYDEDISTQYPYISMLSFVELYMKESMSDNVCRRHCDPNDYLKSYTRSRLQD